MRQSKKIDFMMARANAARYSAQKIDDRWKFKIKYNINNLKKP